MLQELKSKVLEIKSELDEKRFLALAKEVYDYQKKNNLVYKKYLKLTGWNNKKISDITDFPFLPISFFKSQRISSLPNSEKHAITFRSSGTTSAETSEHYLYDQEIYNSSFTTTFNRFFPNHEKKALLALLPSYEERADSSLIYMVNGLLKSNKNKQSGFYQIDDRDFLQLLTDSKVPKILIGVSFVLLDLASKKIPCQNLTVIETGGMKGRRKEMIRAELHQILTKGLHVNQIHSEYGMTELLSQAYLIDASFRPAHTMKVLSRDLTDPLQTIRSGKGGLNIIDLSNIESCAFIATEDLGEVFENGNFTVDGRVDHAQIRGCNLLYSPT